MTRTSSSAWHAILRGNDINLLGTADSIKGGGGNIVIEGGAAGTSVGVGDTAPGTLLIDNTDLAAIEDGQASITIGRTDSTALLSTKAVAFADPVTLRSGGAGGGIKIDGALSTSTADDDITLKANDMDVSSTVTTTGTSGDINLFTGQAARDISIGVDDASKLSLEQGELQNLASAGVVTIGEDVVHTGVINLGGAVDLSAESFGVTLATEGTIDDAAGGNTLTLAGTEVLTLDALSATGTIGATNALDTAATVIDADAGGAKLRIDNAGTVTDLQLNADLGTITFTNTMAVTTGAAITANVINITAGGTLTVNNTVTADQVGGVTVTLATTGTSTIDTSQAIEATMGDVTLRTDSVSLASSVTGQNINLFTETAGRAITLGKAVGSTLSLTQAALQQLATPSGGTVTVGETTVHTGGITVSGDVDLSGENFHLTLNSDGALGTGIDDSEGDKTITLNAKTLTLSAQGGIGATNAIKFDAATVSAVNSGTGMELKLAPTGDITLGSASTKIDQNVSGGSIDVTAGGKITVAGDVEVTGAGTITLDAMGKINGTLGETVSAPLGSVVLGTGGNTTQIGNTTALETAATVQLKAVATGGLVLTIDNTGDLADLQLTATSGTITYTNAGTADTGAAIAAKAISISATDTLTIDENVTASAGALTRATTVAGKNLAFTGANTISGTGGVVTLRSDDMNLAGMAVTAAGGANINVFTTSAARAISLGAEVAGKLSLVQAEAQVLDSTGLVTIGDITTHTGGITIGAADVDLSAESFDLTLTTKGAIDGDATGKTLTIKAAETLTLNALTTLGATNTLNTAATVIDADAGGATLKIANTGAVTDLRLNAANGTITYTNVGTVNTGAAISAQAISLSADNTLTIDENVTSSAGAVTVATTAAGQNLAFTAGTISATGGDVMLESDDMALSGTSAVTGPNIKLFTTSAARPISIGAAVGAVCPWKRESCRG